MSETFREIVVEGPLLLVKGYVAGLLVGKGLDHQQVIFAREKQVRCEGFFDELASWVRLHEHYSHLLVPESVHDLIKPALQLGEEIFGVVVRSDRPIHSASFDFSYIAYTQQHAEELLQLMKSHPENVRLSDDFQPKVLVDPQADGVELYTPAHGYEVHAHGTATGDLPSIFTLFERCMEHDLIKLNQIVLHHPDD